MRRRRRRRRHSRAARCRHCIRAELRMSPCERAAGRLVQCRRRWRRRRAASGRRSSGRCRRSCRRRRPLKATRALSIERARVAGGGYLWRMQWSEKILVWRRGRRAKSQAFERKQQFGNGRQHFLLFLFHEPAWRKTIARHRRTTYGA